MATARVTAEKTFPTPTDRADASYVLIFDGNCKFCRANIQFIHAVDRGKVAYLSLHDAVVQERWPDLTYDQMMKHMYLVDLETGEKHPGVYAFRLLSRKLMGLWVLAPFLHIPGSLPVWRFLYSQIAKHRYKFGRVEECDGACELHFD